MMVSLRTVLLTALSIVLVTLAANPATAQTSWALDPSVRAAGMGRISMGVFWDPASASWENPGILGYQHGVGYAYGRKQWGANTDSWFTTNRLVLGGRGVGLVLNGWPLGGLGGHTLEISREIEVSDKEGESAGATAFHRKQDVSTVGIGVNIAEFLSQTLPPLEDALCKVVRFADLSIGLAVSDTESSTEFGQERSKAEARTKDFGLLARLTLYNSIDYPGMLPGLDAFLRPLAGGIRIDGAYGYSYHNFDEAESFSTALNSMGRLPEYERHGWVVRLGSGLPSGVESWFDTRGMQWLAKSLTPLISWGIGWDHRDEYLNPPFGPPREAKERGWELAIANIFAVRRGEITDKWSTTSTSGWGVGFEVYSICGFHYDEAAVPDSDRTWKGFNLFFQPVRLWQVLRGAH